MLTEEVSEARPWTEAQCVFNPYDGISDKLRQMLGNDYQHWWNMGQEARDFMCTKYRFRDMVLAGVKESLGSCMSELSA